MLPVDFQYVRQFLLCLLVIATVYQHFRAFQVTAKRATLQFLFNLEEIKSEFACRLVPLLPVFRQRTRHHLVEPRRVIFQELTKRRGRSAHNLLQRLGNRSAFKRQGRCQGLI